MMAKAKEKRTELVSLTRKFSSRKEWERYVWKKIVEGFADTTDSKEIEKSLNLLLTNHEKKQMINRAAAVSMIRQGKTYKEIGDVLWLSPTTISAIKKSMKAGEGYVSTYDWGKIRNKSKKPEKHDGFRIQFSLLLNALFEIPPPPRQGRRIPAGTQGVVRPHGKLVFPQKR